MFFNLSNPKDVARDGYKALMKGKSKVVSGLKNKVQVAISNVLTNESITAGSRKSMDEKVDKNAEKKLERKVKREERKIIREKKKEQRKK